MIKELARCLWCTKSWLPSDESGHAEETSNTTSTPSSWKNENKRLLTFQKIYMMKVACYHRWIHKRYRPRGSDRRGARKSLRLCGAADAESLYVNRAGRRTSKRPPLHISLLPSPPSLRSSNGILLGKQIVLLLVANRPCFNMPRLRGSLLCYSQVRDTPPPPPIFNISV